MLLRYENMATSNLVVTIDIDTRPFVKALKKIRRKMFFARVRKFFSSIIRFEFLL
jgi:hypothetical protein